MLETSIRLDIQPCNEISDGKHLLSKKQKVAMPSTDGACVDIVPAVPKIMQADLYLYGISSRTVPLAGAGTFSVSLLQYVNYNIIAASI